MNITTSTKLDEAEKELLDLINEQQDLPARIRKASNDMDSVAVLQISERTAILPFLISGARLTLERLHLIDYRQSLEKVGRQIKEATTVEDRAQAALAVAKSAREAATMALNTANDRRNGLENKIDAAVAQIERLEGHLLRQGQGVAASNGSF